MSGYFLGVDIGNTKSLAVISDADGRGLSIAKAGNGNHEVIGPAGFSAVLGRIVSQAISRAQIDVTEIAGAGFGIAGYDWESDLPLMNAGIATLGLKCPYHVVNDCEIGLVAGASEGWGVVVSSGTSCNASGRDRQGREGRMTGNGAAYGEIGGGHEVVDYAIEHISRAWSKRGPSTLLSELFVAHCGASGVTDLLEGLARGRYHTSAKDAPLVFEAVRRGDQVALAGLRWIADGLADLAIGIINQLDLHQSEFEIVLSASFFNGSPLIARWMAEKIQPVAPQARLVRLDAPPVAGGVLLGMEQVMSPTAAIRDAVRSSCTALLTEIDNA